METEQQIWRAWVDTLRQRGLSSFVALVLEAAGPLNFIAAQFVYLGQPLLGSTGSMQALAHLLEDTEQTHTFVTFLREDTPR